MSDTTQTIDLTSPRHVVFTEGGNLYTYTLQAPITDSNWRRYFAGIVSTSETVGKDIVPYYNNSTASAELVRAAVVDVAGYKVRNGENLTDLANWKTLLPERHLLTVASNLRAVERIDGEPVVLGTETVTLAAIWGLSTDATAMRRIANLVHRFTPPTIEHQRRYDRDRNRSIIVGGSRTGKTRWVGAQGTLIDIYDELIVSVEGYSAKGEPLSDVDNIRLRMDAYHKVAAAEGLFAQAIVDEQEVTA